MIQTQAPGPESSLYFHEDGGDVDEDDQHRTTYSQQVPFSRVSKFTPPESPWLVFVDFKHHCKGKQAYQFYIFPKKVTIWQTLWQMLDGEQWWGPDLVAEKRPFCGFAVGGDRGWTSGQAHVNHGLANWAHVHNWPRGGENQNLVKGYSWPCQVKLSWKSLPTPKSYLVVLPAEHVKYLPALAALIWWWYWWLRWWWWSWWRWSWWSRRQIFENLCQLWRHESGRQAHQALPQAMLRHAPALVQIQFQSWGIKKSCSSANTISKLRN